MIDSVQQVLTLLVTVGSLLGGLWYFAWRLFRKLDTLLGLPEQVRLLSKEFHDWRRKTSDWHEEQMRKERGGGPKGRGEHGRGW